MDVSQSYHWTQCIYNRRTMLTESNHLTSFHLECGLVMFSLLDLRALRQLKYRQIVSLLWKNRTEKQMKIDCQYARFCKLSMHPKIFKKYKLFSCFSWENFSLHIIWTEIWGWVKELVVHTPLVLFISSSFWGLSHQISCVTFQGNDQEMLRFLIKVTSYYEKKSGAMTFFKPVFCNFFVLTDWSTKMKFYCEPDYSYLQIMKIKKRFLQVYYL